MSEEITFEELEPKMAVSGTVKKIDLMGAVLDVLGHPALLHISQVADGRKVGVDNINDVLNVDDELTVYVMQVDKAGGKLLVSMVKPPAVEWDEIAVGKVFDGTVVRLKKYGAFVDIGAERPGLVHVSELSNDYVEHPKDAVKRGDEVQVKVIGLDRGKNQIDLSMKALTAPPQQQTTFVDESDTADLPTAMAVALQRALEQSDNESPEPQAKKKDSGKKRDGELDNILRDTLERHKSS